MDIKSQISTIPGRDFNISVENGHKYNYSRLRSRVDPVLVSSKFAIIELATHVSSCIIFV